MNNNTILTESIYAYLIEGSIAVILNLPLAAVMLTVKKLRARREFQVIVGLALTDVCFGAAFILTGVDRLPAINLVNNGGIPAIPRSSCTRYLFVQLLTISYQMQGILSTVVAFDRFIAITFPIKYIKFGRWYNTVIIATPCVIVFIPTFINFMLTYTDETMISSLCVTAEAVYPGFHSYVLLMRISCILCSGLIYVFIVWRLKQHFARIERTTHNVGTTQMRNIRRSTVTVGLTTINALLFLVVPDIIAYFGIGGIHTKYATLLYSFYAANVNLNFVILIVRHHEIRNNIANIIRVILFRKSQHSSYCNSQSHQKIAISVVAQKKNVSPTA
ncbi:hypothetical protein Y032_0088g2120 [Ancylostoma ceylanicum]|nr:hypothetical protein Y032_0088g2120 [Ancylostoma ceylanicum]